MSEPNPTLLGRAMTRRRMLQGSALAGVAAFLAACGTAARSAAPSAAPSAAASGTPSAAASASPVPSPTAVPSPAAVLNFANWPLYIDQDTSNPPKSPTLDSFSQKYGTKVNYKESINDNEQFFGTIQPVLQAGQDTGWDLIVMTDWMAARIITPRLDGDDRHGQHAQLRGQRERQLQGPGLGSRQQQAGPLAVRHDRPRLRLEGRRQRHHHGIHVAERSPLDGQGLDADGDARHRRARPC